jgi:hypothetical protein
MVTQGHQPSYNSSILQLSVSVAVLRKERTTTAEQE